MDRPLLFRLDRIATIDAFAGHVNQSPQNGRSNRNRDRRTGIEYLHPAHQTIGGVDGDRANAILTKVLLHFADKEFLLARVRRRAGDVQCVENGWDFTCGEFNVDHRSNDLNDTALVHASSLNELTWEMTWEITVTKRPAKIEIRGKVAIHEWLTTFHMVFLPLVRTYNQEPLHPRKSVMSSYIVSAVRTPIGALLGSLSSLSAPQLGAVAIKAAVERANLDPNHVDEVIMGNVLTGGVGQAPARQAAIFAGLSKHTACMTINKVCGSGLKSVMLADQAIRCGDAHVVVAGGQESMTNAPHAMLDSRKGVKFGDARMVDLMQWDGLWEVYNQVPMGNAADLCATTCNISREEQDAFTIESYKRAQAAIAEGRFAAELAPVTIAGRKGDTVVDTDEEPGRVQFDKIASLKPVFTKDGTVTAANASTINDGAAALVIASEAALTTHNLKPMARIVAQASYAHAPMEFTSAPIEAIRKVTAKAGMSVADIDLFEINEAFAVVTLAAQQALDIPHSKVNVHGGAVALGHPIGASGARVLTTLVHALRAHGKKTGLATLCIGGGEASAIIIELV